jgi:hypothetical protein
MLTSLSLTLLVGLHTQPGHAVSSNPSARNVTLYWHYSNTPVSVGGIQTNYVLNSTSRFDFQTQQTAKQNSIYKGTGLASVAVDFYAYPNLVGPATLNGTWQVFVSANSSGFHPTVFNIEFREFPLGSGTATWDSGQINPIVTSSVGSYVDVPVYSYNLTTPTALGHTFAQGSTIDLTVTVNDGAVADARIWYDSPFYQSKVILPVVNPGEPAKIWTADTTGAVKSTFPLQSQTIMISTNATDPFGGYDVNATAIGTKEAPVTLTLTGPSGSALVNGQRMTQLAGGVAVLNNLFQYNASISGIAGNYIATVSSTDNSGNIEQLSYTFAVSTVSPPASLLTSLLPIIIIIGLIAVVVAVFAITRRRKKKTVQG